MGKPEDRGAAEVKGPEVMEDKALAELATERRVVAGSDEAALLDGRIVDEGFAVLEFLDNEALFPYAKAAGQQS
ncbi:MAG: hypothetical protein Q9214_007967, partial [Letrouitia sp. 1 TL-2023]